ncbi:MAG: hypothetical protein GY906_13090 [bacterium]|nr:hypothetical protein [bacterium]
MPTTKKGESTPSVESSRIWMLLTRFSVPVTFAAISFAFMINGRVTTLEAGQVDAVALEAKIDQAMFESNDKFTTILVELQALRGTAPVWLVDRIDKIEDRVLKLEGEK